MGPSSTQVATRPVAAQAAGEGCGLPMPQRGLADEPLAPSTSSVEADHLGVGTDRDKQSRLISQIDLFEGGSVLLPKDAPWLDAFVSELLSFPGRHDDQVDALSQGLAWRREACKGPLVQRRAIGLGG